MLSLLRFSENLLCLKCFFNFCCGSISFVNFETYTFNGGFLPIVSVYVVGEYCGVYTHSDVIVIIGVGFEENFEWT